MALLRPLEPGVDQGHLAVVVDQDEGVDQVVPHGGDAPDTWRELHGGTAGHPGNLADRVRRAAA